MTERKSKQVLVVRKDLNMRKGKIAAQCAHASMKVLLDLMSRGTYTTSKPEFIGVMPVRKEIPVGSPAENLGDEVTTYQTRTLTYEPDTALGRWLEGSFTKICVSVNSEVELVEVYEKALAAGLPASLIIDNGYTEFKGVPTKTVIAIGPAWEDEINPITGHLPLL